jgi:hypothetical protein
LWRANLMLALNRSHFEKGIWSYNCSEVLDVNICLQY